MKLLFIDLLPSKAFQVTLSSHAFSSLTISSVPNEKLKEKVEMVVCAVKDFAQFESLALFRKNNPEVWLAVVVPLARLQDSEFFSNLLERDIKDAVWLEGQWESLFWFSFQQMLDSQNRKSRLQVLEQKVMDFEARAEALSQTSLQLIDKFKKDVDLAENIQRMLRPKFSPNIPGLSLSVKYIPSIGVGGDYYDVFEFGDKKRFGVLLADSKSHGLAAALLSVLLKLRLEEMKDRFPDSKSFVYFVNQEIRSVYQKSSSSMSLLYGILDRASLSFQFTSAGNIQPIVWRRGQPLNIKMPSNPEVGSGEQFDYRECVIQLQPGDLMMLFTDGLTIPLKNKKMTAEQRINELLKNKGVSVDPLQMQNELMGIVDAYTSKKKLKDDLTLIQLAVDERAMYVAKVEGD